MSRILLTYDVTTRHSEVKDAMKKRGYADSFSFEGGIVYLPNTTLMKAGTDASVARRDLEQAVDELNRRAAPGNRIGLERLMAVVYDNWAALWGTQSLR